VHVLGFGLDTGSGENGALASSPGSRYALFSVDSLAEVLRVETS
jgi:hypothetical protein